MYTPTSNKMQPPKRTNNMLYKFSREYVKHVCHNYRGEVNECLYYKAKNPSEKALIKHITNRTKDNRLIVGIIFEECKVTESFIVRTTSEYWEYNRIMDIYKDANYPLPVSDEDEKILKVMRSLDA